MRLASSLVALLLASFPLPLFAAEPTTSEQSCISAFENAQRKQLAAKMLDARGEALQCVAPSCPAEVADACTKLLSDIEANTPTVVIAARIGDADIADARLSIDGVTVAERLTGQSLKLDPGEHLIRIEPKVQDLAAKESTVVIKLGERNRLITVDFTAKAETAGARIGPVPGAVLASLGGLSLVAGLATGILSLQKDSDLGDRCGTIDACPPDAQPDIDELHALSAASTGTLIGGGVVAATGIVLLIVAAVTDSPLPVEPTARGFSIAF